MDQPVNEQKAHYESIHDEYEKHYYDASSMRYRQKFFYDPLFKGESLDGMLVAEIACGSGHNSVALKQRFPTMRSVGFDISEPACKAYRDNTGGESNQVDLTLPYTPDRQYDAAVVIGGLHHCVNGLCTVFDNLARMIKPGGMFYMMEPNAQFLLNNVRDFWYRNDDYFEADSEAALYHDALALMARPYFTPRRVHYFGGPAFYLIFNSLIMRVPLKAKPWLSKILFPLETAYNAMPFRFPFASFTASWQRTEIQP